MRVARGTGYLYFAYDLGQGIDVEAAARLLPLPGEPAVVRHRRPAPRYFQYEPPPLRVRLDVPSLEIGGKRTGERAEAVLFDRPYTGPPRTPPPAKATL